MDLVVGKSSRVLTRRSAERTSSSKLAPNRVLGTSTRGKGAARAAEMSSLRGTKRILEAASFPGTAAAAGSSSASSSTRKGAKRSIPSLTSTKPVTKKMRILAAEVVVDEEDKRGAGSLALTGGKTILEKKSVKVGQKVTYAMYLSKFKDFCMENERGVFLGPNTDATLVDFFDMMFLDNKGAGEGEKTLAAVEWEKSSLKGHLPRARVALKGWRKERPHGSRLPLPKLVAYGMAMYMIGMGGKDGRTMGLKLLADFDMYLRPSESLAIKGRDVVAPVVEAGKHFQHYTVIIRDLADGIPDKVGTYDNSILLDNPENMSFLGPELHAMAQRVMPADPIFLFSQDSYRKEFQRAGDFLGLPGLHTYQTRHGGASDDLNSKLRDRREVRDRGRWATDTSVRRYGKIGKVQQLLRRLSQKKLEFCKWAFMNMPRVLQGQIAAKTG
jgi:hypothetical protein